MARSVRHGLRGAAPSRTVRTRALGASPIVATDIAPERRKIAKDLNLVDHVLPADDTAGATIAKVTGSRGCEASIDCSGSGAARVFALKNTRTWAAAPSLARAARSHSPSQSC
jgi:threonine dehydrogenase-like Zn-dependent dehydrogenase